MLQGASALFELGGRAFSQGANAPEQVVGGASVRVQRLLGTAPRAPDRDENADACTEVAAHTGDAVELDQRAVQDHVGQAVVPAAVQNLVQVGARSARTSMPSCNYGLPERAQHPTAARSADAAPVRGKQWGQVMHNVARDIERGNIADQREAFRVADTILC
ncbi:hypothetical protein [Streptacidiphilus jiangxiensis]|uniref:Uncharacterized protein n=1 Tax=Streptacidiphilus jiangxiensis TaxID=235985 RepID=A0A1H7WCE6_STRJI|nr:hypothetical protein [Streptacidiphilus jiangxiensis]SEM19181.1 hypothetical protein SAMN05414137_12070 [Streptacidiphilus jiangxiensis]